MSWNSTKSFLCVALVAAVGCGAPGDGAREGRAPLRDLRYLAEGYLPTHTVGEVQRDEAARRAHTVSRALPELAFSDLAAVMLGHGSDPVASDHVRALEGERVRVRGWALPMPEASTETWFVLRDEPHIDCGNVEPPPTNRQVLVRLADDVRFDWWDGPLWVEGVLRLGRYETFRGGDLAVYLLEDARYEALDPESMVLPVLVHPRHDHGHQGVESPDLHLRPRPH